MTFFNTLYGDNLVVHIFFWISILVLVADFSSTWFTIFYQRFWYPRVICRSFIANYTPTCSIIIPCKGIIDNLETNLRSFLNMDYPDYEIVFVVESASDAAHAVIQSIAATDKRVRCTVAGFTKSCAQKNHNLLAAIAASSATEVLVFADADIKPKSNWMRELVAPLSNPKFTVATGFRWLLSSKGTAGEMVHASINGFMYILFSCASFFGSVGLWGGSMAIRRRDFESMKVADCWSVSAVDDMSLSQVLLKHGKISVLVSSCVTRSSDLIDTVGNSVAWFERQIMYLKAHQKNLWFILCPIVAMGLFCFLWLPLAALLAIFSGKDFFALGGGAAAIFFLAEFGSQFFYRGIGPMPFFGRYIIMWPVSRISHMYSFIRTCFTNSIIWSRIRYTIAYNGTVTKVERLS